MQPVQNIIQETLRSNLPDLHPIRKVVENLGNGEQALQTALDELTEEEITHIRLRRAEAQRQAEIKALQDAYWAKVKAPYPVFNAQQMLDFITTQGKQFADKEGWTFALDDINRPVYTLLAQYFAQDPAFEEQGYSLRKGLLVFGNIGTGKTTMMQLFSVNTRQSYTIYSCRRISDLYTEQGNEIIQRASSIIPSMYATQYFGQQHLALCLDDLGTENTASHFRNQKNVIAEIIQNRYENTELRGMTHITTNLTANEIRTTYGERVYDRLREMMNVISYSAEAESRRR